MFKNIPHDSRHDHEDMDLILRIQALVDNELPPDEIPELMSALEGNYRLRNEYISLLQIKRRLAGIPEMTLRKEWYEKFERRKRYGILPRIGLAAFILYGLWAFFLYGADLLDFYPPRWLHITGLGSLSAGILSFAVHGVLQKSAEKKGERSYEDVLR